MGSVHPMPGLPPAAASRLAGKLLLRHSPHEIAEAITVLIDVLDLLGGDPEAEDTGWPEDPRAVIVAAAPDDAEADDPPEDDDAAEEDDPAGQADEDGVNTGPRGGGRKIHRGPGCAVSDPGEA